jgi:hypothetical protein
MSTDIRGEVEYEKTGLAKRVDKINFALLLMLNALSTGKDVEGNRVILELPKKLIKQIESLLTH